MDSTAIVAHLESSLCAFKTGSSEWGVHSETSDIDMVVPAERLDMNTLKEQLKEWKWAVYDRVTASGHGIKLHSLGGFDNRDIDLIVVPADKIERWRLATNIVSALVLSSSAFKEAIKQKNLRVGFFEGLRALFMMVGV